MEDKLLHAVLSSIDSHREEMLNLWRKLVEIEGDITNKAGTDQIARTISDLLANWEVPSSIISMERAGNSLAAEWGVRHPEPPVLLMGHMDTVFPKGTLAEIPFRIEDSKAYGPGVLDMKGGLVIALYALRALMDAGSPFRATRRAVINIPVNAAESCLRPARKAAGPPSTLRPVFSAAT